MKLNQKLIKQLRNDEIFVENNGTIEQLREVLEAAFPKDVIPTGSFKYYSRSAVNKDVWMGYSFRDEDKPTFKISDFYQPEPFIGWAKDDYYPKWMVYFKNDVAKFGFNTFGEWCDEIGLAFCKYSEDETTHPATNEEIETTLTKEAKRRGYKGGDTIKGIHDTKHTRPKICSFTYDPEHDRLLTDEYCVVYEKGQWAGIIEQTSQPKPKTNPIHYTVGCTTYSLNYQELKAEYDNVVAYSDEVFMDNLSEIAHLACIVSYFKGLGVQATISDKGIIHELIHLMTEPSEPTNNLQEIREKFNHLIRLV